MDVTSRPPWNTWHSQLNTEDHSLIVIFRAGAVHSATRSQRDRSKGFEPCHVCEFHTPSFRHWWAECPRPQADRDAAADASPLPFLRATFWPSAPKCTAKSGWITYEAHRDADVRSHLAVAAASVALAVMHAEAEILKRSGAV